MKKILMAAAALMLIGTAAQAATTFDFTNGSRSQTSGTLNYSADGINLAVSSARYYNPSGSRPLGAHDYGDIGQSNGNGLYIQWGSNDNTHQIDGSGKDEVALFQFSQDVKLESVSFNYNSSHDQFAFFFDNNGDGKLYNNQGDLINSSLNANPTDTYAFLGALLKTGDLFGIGAIASNDDFKIASITVSAVPLPAGLPLYGAGLAVLGFVGWRKKQKAAAKA